MQSAVSAGPMGAKIEVSTKVYSVAVDGSVQLLWPSPSFALDPSTLKHLSARILLQTPSATGSPAEMPKKRLAGDVLRYEITVSNETDFLLPAFALDIREQPASAWRYWPTRKSKRIVGILNWWITLDHWQAVHCEAIGIHPRR